MVKPRTKLRLVSKLLALTVMLAATAFVGLQERKAGARPCHEVEHYYYSDATHANMVGYKWFYCNGTYSWGVVTPHVFTVDGGDCGCWDQFP